jgi:hypothetical protein
MTDVLSLKPKGLVLGRPFAKGPSNRSAGRRAGSRNKRTFAAAVLLDGEAEALTRRAVELALADDPWTFSPRARPVGAMRLCIERLLQVCAGNSIDRRESAVDPR